jgi:hypothetical protein
MAARGESVRRAPVVAAGALLQTDNDVFIGTQPAGRDYYEGLLEELSFTVG